MKLFVAYPNGPDILVSPIRTAVDQAKSQFPKESIVSWEEGLTPGSFIGTEVISEIVAAHALIADVTVLNFNVLYEIAYAIGIGKPVLLTVNRSIETDSALRRDVGLIDTLLYKEYENSNELLRLMVESVPQRAIPVTGSYDRKQPVFLMETRFKTDFSTKLSSRIRKARLNPRIFDASEQSRMSGPKTITEVVSSYGVVVHLAHSDEKDSRIHNMRGAFLVGLAHGLDRVLLAIQHGDSPVPIDYIDLVKACKHPTDIHEAVADFGAEVLSRLTGDSDQPVAPRHETLLERIDFGASAAENEFRKLGRYYLETEEFRKTTRGEARLVVGRKGTGKSALFFHLRDSKRNDTRNLVLDLKPEGYQLRKLRDIFEIALGEGTYEHSLTAFWDYLLRLEIARAILKHDSKKHRYDHTIYDAYRGLEEIYKASGAEPAGSFSERLAVLIARIVSDLKSYAGSKENVFLSEPNITEIIYGKDFHKLEGALSHYLNRFEEVWILFDNLDKGWPAYGLDDADILIARTLLEGTRKIERWVNEKLDIECHAVTFIRNDVFELLIGGTPDRGKESKVLLDWTDADVLRQLLLRRMLATKDVPSDSTFEDLWRSICAPLIGGEETSQYILDRCLMRPRFLLDLISHCKSFAVNLEHDTITKGDIRKGLQAYSNDVLTDISLELRDVAPYAEDVLYSFIGASAQFDLDFMIGVIRENKFDVSRLDNIIELMLWYGFLGLVKPSSEPQFIYDVNYSMKTLLAIRRQNAAVGLQYQINRAFWPVLEIE